MRAIITR